MNVKIIKTRKSNSARNAIYLLKEAGWESVKLSVDRRSKKKHKVIEAIRSHKKYKEQLKNTLLFEGVISILNRKDFWVGSPDFLVWNDEEIFFCEFKSYKDTFRHVQLSWFEKFDMLPTAFAFAVLDVKDFKKDIKKQENKDI